ncbi:MAG: hypothetical protein AAGG75_03165 [Bacteroidota bacterium]
MITAPDRLQQLIDQSQVAGIDFVFVDKTQQQLDVYFFEHINGHTNPLLNSLLDNQIVISSPDAGEGLQLIPATIIDANNWPTENGRRVLRLQTPVAGDFTHYYLFIDDPNVDPYYNNIRFSFKANCESDLDCAPPPHECPPEELVDFPVNYLARDFWSFRRALLDFASQRYPEWTDRLEADGGIMLAEVMSALGDEMAYYQDRIAREAYLETATQRRSVRRHARLVDYTVHDGRGAQTWIDVQVRPSAAIPMEDFVPTGVPIYAASDSGLRTYFEIGTDLQQMLASPKVRYNVDHRRNRFLPHIWDEDDVCLNVGTTEMHVQSQVAFLFDSANLAPDPMNQYDNRISEWVLLQTQPNDPAIPARRHMVKLIAIEDTTDPVFGTPITRLEWEEAQALPFEMNQSFMEVHANMIPATAGISVEQYFIVGREPSSLPIPLAEQERLDRAVERQGHDETLTYLFSLPGSDFNQLVWLGDDVRKAEPELHLEEVVFDNGANEWVPELGWDWRRALVGRDPSNSEANDFMLDDGSWRRVKGYYRQTEEIVHKDYASDAGKTIRFGDNEFGRTPTEQTVFRVHYRLGGGKNDNVAADTLVHIPQSAEEVMIPTSNGPIKVALAFTPLNFIESVNNPLAANGGMDPESNREVRQLASEAFRAVTCRAVRPEDYAEAAERLDWVQKAGATFRWTGSWLSAFVTPDPRDTVLLSETHRTSLVQQLDRFRQAGREAHVLDPIYANMHLEITICVAPDAYKGEVKEQVLLALFGRRGLRPIEGYFDPDNFTFGTPLDRSTLEAAIQQVPGVRAVESISYERRGFFQLQAFKKLTYDPGKDTIIRVENDPLHPERGSVKLLMNGGA